MGNPCDGVMEQSWLPKAGVQVLSGCYFGASLGAESLHLGDVILLSTCILLALVG